jgi:hypothetical protein
LNVKSNVKKIASLPPFPLSPSLIVREASFFCPQLMGRRLASMGPPTIRGKSANSHRGKRRRRRRNSSPVSQPQVTPLPSPL